MITSAPGVRLRSLAAITALFGDRGLLQPLGQLRQLLATMTTSLDFLAAFADSTHVRLLCRPGGAT